MMHPVTVASAVDNEFIDYVLHREHNWQRGTLVAGGQEAPSVNRRCWCEDLSKDGVVQDVCESLFDVYPDVETNDQMQISLMKYRAEDVGNFETHQDVNYELGELCRKLSMTILLSDSDQGGELEIMNSKQTLSVGDAIVFPSYLPHSVKPVTAGERISLVAWRLGEHWR